MSSKNSFNDLLNKHIKIKNGKTLIDRKSLIKDLREKEFKEIINYSLFLEKEFSSVFNRSGKIASFINNFTVSISGFTGGRKSLKKKKESVQLLLDKENIRKKLKRKEELKIMKTIKRSYKKFNETKIK